MIIDLTEREREIAVLVAQGLCNKEIGRALGISHQTVKNHLTAIYDKWKINGRTQLVIVVFALEWVRPFDAYSVMVGYGRQ